MQGSEALALHLRALLEGLTGDPHPVDLGRRSCRPRIAWQYAVELLAHNRSLLHTGFPVPTFASGLYMHTLQRSILWLLCIGLLACEASPSGQGAAKARTDAASATASETKPPPVKPKPKPREQVVVESLAIDGDMPVFALKGGRRDGIVGVVLHGHCGHGLGFLQAFQFGAAAAGQFISVQGDRRCGTGALRAWSADTALTHQRIETALQRYIGKMPDEVLLVGSSQGAQVAFALARQFPDTYTRLVLLGTFKENKARGLSHLKSVHFFVGEHENPWPSRLSANNLERAGVNAGVTIIEGAGHSDWHGRGNSLIRELFRDWQLLS